MGMNKSTAHISPEDRERILSLYRDFTSWRSEKFEEEDYTQARALISYKTKLPPSAPEIDQFICYMAGNNHAMIFEDCGELSFDWESLKKGFLGNENDLDY